ncbi:MAG: hypothetical protein JSV44_09580, partial [Candidatus Zixiibacteriota bacterium]
LLDSGDTKAANCVSCHSVHNIESPQIPTSSVYALNLPGTCAECHADPDYMAGYGIATNQYDHYVKSVHGVALLERGDIGAPACNDCHGNHGAVPPEVASISAVCGLCHALIAEEFAMSPHDTVFEKADFPKCETCHSNHLIMKPELHWVGTTDSSLCINCHDANDGTAGFRTAEQIYNSLSDLYAAHGKAAAKVDEAEYKGMMITDLRFQLREVKQSLIKARTVVHAFNAARIIEVVEPGLLEAAKVYEAAVQEVDEYYFRRKGLGVATLIITILAIALYLKIRSIEK